MEMTGLTLMWTADPDHNRLEIPGRIPTDPWKTRPKLRVFNIPTASETGFVNEIMCQEDAPRLRPGD